MSGDSFVGREPLESTGAAPRQIVRSAEQVQLELPLAGPATRMLAYLADLVVILLLELMLLVLVFFLAAASPLLTGYLDELRESAGGLASGDPTEVGGFLVVFVALFVLLQLVAEWGYFLVCEMTTGGRSLGKALLRLRVVVDGGGRITFRASLVRNLLRLVDILPSSYLVGLIAMVVSPEGKRLGDVAAGTVVVRLDAAPPARPVVSLSGPDSAEFPFDRRQLSALGPAERALVRQTLRRLDDLAPDQAERALERACAVITARLGGDEVPPRRRRAYLEALWQLAERRPRPAQGS